MPFPVDFSFIQRAEERLGVKLPPSYKARLCRCNGGGVRANGDGWQLFPVFDSSDRKRIKRTCNDIVHETNWARRYHSFPPGGIAIASNGTPDRLVLLYSELEGRCGDAVFRWYYDTGELVKVADDFLDFFPEDI
jgi:hypothetical protein